MLYREIIVVCSEIHTKTHKYTVWAERRIIYKDPVRTAQYTHSVSVIKTSQLMLRREIIAVCSQINTKHINTLCGQNIELYTKTQSAPRSKHTFLLIKTSQLMLYREIIAVCSQIHTKHTNTLCGQNVELYI